LRPGIWFSTLFLDQGEDYVIEVEELVEVHFAGRLSLTLCRFAQRGIDRAQMWETG
jgi:hypothetical protein